MSPRYVGMIATAVALTVLAPVVCVAAVPEHSKVVLRNGSWLVGDLKSLKRGLLEFKTGATETIYVKWVDVQGISSSQMYEVVLSDGRTYFGSLDAPEEGDGVMVVGIGGTFPLGHDDVVVITKIKDSFWRRLSGSLSIGYNYTQASDLTTISFAGDVTHRTRKQASQLSYESFFTRQKNQQDRQRQSLDFTYTRYLKNRWLALGSFGLQQNDELGIRLRQLLTVGTGRYVVQTNSNTLNLSIGVAGNREQTEQVKEIQTSAEGVLYCGYEFFRLKQPKLDLSTSLVIYPSITERDRTRGEFRFNLTWEMIADFTIGLRLLQSYDSRPPTTAQAKSDRAVVFTVGWTF